MQSPNKPLKQESAKAGKNIAPIIAFLDKSPWAAYLFFGLVSLAAVLVFWDYLVFHRIYMFGDVGSDTLNTFYTAMVETSKHLREYGNLSWTFNAGMGQNGAAIALGDPFNALVYLFPVSKIPYLFGYKEVLKIVLAGMVFYGFLRKTGNCVYASSIGGLMYAFSGFMIVAGGWYVFSAEALNLALVLLGFELLYQDKKYWLFPLPFFIMGLSSPFDFYTFGVFTAVYAVFRYLQDDKKGIKDIAVLFLKIAGLGLVGIAVSAPFLIPGLKAILESTRASGADSHSGAMSAIPVFKLSSALELCTIVMRAFSGGMVGTGNAYRGIGNYLEGPLLYCGIPCLLLVPLLFGYIGKKEKKLFAVFLALWLLPLLFPYLRRAFWLFSGDYYRIYSLFVAVFFIILSVRALGFVTKRKGMDARVLAIIAVVLIAVQLLPYISKVRVVNEEVATGAKFYVLAYAALLFWMSRSGANAPLALFLLLFLSEIIWFSSLSVNRNASVKTAGWKEKLGYNDYSVDAVTFIKERDTTFYRVDKSYGSAPSEARSLNDGMVQDYYGTSSYNSFNQKYYLQYMRACGVISANDERESRWCDGLIRRPILESLNSVKYILAKEHIYRPNDPVHDSLAKFGDVTVYRNKTVLPLGFCYDRCIKLSDFEKLSAQQKDYVSLQAAVVNDTITDLPNGLKTFSLQDTIAPMAFSLAYYEGLINSLKTDTLKISSFAPAKISGTINLASAKIMYLSIPYDMGWHLEVDGQPYNITLIANGMMGVILEKGNHELTMSYATPFGKQSKLAAILGLLIFGGLLYNGRNRKV